MRTNTFLSISLGIAAVSCFHAGSVQALSFTAEDFTGDNAAGKITLENWVNDSVKITAEIISPTINGDISGLWFGLKDTSLLSSLNISDLMTNTGDDSFDYSFNSDPSSTSCLSSGQNNLNGGDKEFCKSGLTNSLISFGKAGSSGGLVQTVSFVLSSNLTSLAITDFNEAFGLRYQSTGSSKGGSSKLRYYYPGYMGTTSNTFELPEGQTPPPGAVPVGNVEEESNEPVVVHPSGKNKNKGKGKK